MSRQTTTPAILSEEPHGLLSLGWNLFLNLESTKPDRHPRGRDKKARHPTLMRDIVPTLPTMCHKYFCGFWQPFRLLLTQILMQHFDVKDKPFS